MRASACLAWILFLATGLLAPSARADVAAGVAWLDGREISTGVHRPQDLADAADTNAEAWITVARLGASPDFPQLSSAVQSGDDSTLAAKARRAFIRIEQGLAANDLLDELRAEQLADGGFPARPGYQSEVLTTTWVLTALQRAGLGSSTPAGNAVGYLIAAQQSDGGFLSTAGNLSSVFVSAHVARVYSDYRNLFQLQVPMDRLKSYLEAAQRPDLSFGDAFETAFAIEGLLALDVGRPSLGAAASALAALQLANGSFGNDAYITAIATRALWLQQQPDLPPAGAGLTARVLAADSELPITGAQLTLTGVENATLLSDSAGLLRSTSLTAGSYSAILSFPGMQDIALSITVLSGRTLDLGDLRMVQGGSAQHALVRGTITAVGSGLPIAGATIALASPAMQASAGADGRFQLLQVPVGPARFQVSAAGYSSRQVDLQIAAYSVVELSVELTPTVTPTTGARVHGTIRHQGTGAPLAGASIAVIAGAPPVGATSGADGRYEFTVAASPLVTIAVTLAGFDGVTIQLPLADNQVVELSPRLYPQNTTPPGGNSGRIRGSVVNQANRQPIERALIVAVDPSGQRTAQTDSQGRFELSGLNGPIVTLTLTADAFVPASIVVPLVPLEQRELGPIGLRPTTIAAYFPDLAITDSALATTDPLDYRLAQSFTVDVTNRGSSNLRQDFTLLAFVDADGDGRFDAGLEPEVGRTRIDRDLSIATTVSTAVAVTAQMAYRDAPVSFWVDAEQEVPESNEDNNVNSSLLGCRIDPHPLGNDALELSWYWRGLSSNLQINSLTATPSVTQLTDDNADGVINEYDVPDVVFVAGERNTISPFSTALVALSGDDGSEHWANTDLRLSPFSSVATGDIDNDGIAEIVAVNGYRTELVAFEHTGVVKWRVPLSGPGPLYPPIPPPSMPYDQPIIVNLEGDNEAEIVLGRQAYRGLSGELLWQGEFDAGGTAGKPLNSPLIAADDQASIAADVDLDGTMEVIAGRTLYDYQGHARWHRGDIKPVPRNDAQNQRYNASGYVAVGNFDLDDKAEIVLAIEDELYLLEHNGDTIWGPKFAPDGTPFGAPAVADVDADGLPEIVLSSLGRLTVFESDGSVKATQDISDPGGFTTPTLFDFQNDGRLEIVHVDEAYLRLFDSRTVQPLQGVGIYNTTHTVYEIPIVVDVDGDRQAEIIIVGNDDDLVTTPTGGVRVFQARDGAFADAGSVWGSHAFHVDDVGEDSSVPLLETPSWLTHNTYRVQRSPAPDPLGMPDFTVGAIEISDRGPGQDPAVSVRVGNAGPVDAHEPVTVSLYRGAPGAGGQLLRAVRLDSLQPARFQNVDFGVIPRAGSGDLYAVADLAGRADECREQNNQRSNPLMAGRGLGELTVATDRPSYRPGETAIFSADVSNLGGLPAGFSVQWLIRDTLARTTANLNALEFASVPAAQSQQRTLNWPTNGVLAGTYVLSARLLDASGTQIDSASASFAIAGDLSGPAGGLALSTARASYAPADGVAIAFRARNLSSSEVIRAPEVVMTITGPGGFSQTRNLPYGDLFASAFADGSVVVDGAIAPGTYTASGRLRSRVTGFEYATDTLSFERLEDRTATIGGYVNVLRASVPVGDSQTCLYTARNLGTAALPTVPLRRRVIQLESGNVRLQQDVSADLTPGSDYVASDSFSTSGFPSGDYACVFEVGQGSGWRLLASEPFTVLAPAGPAIEVTPVQGLVTRESGQAAEFTVRMTAAPTAEVTVPLSVSDASEFRLPTTSLSFTPANWSVPRQVAVVGVDDTLVDGDVAGSVIVGAATSVDPAYNGLNPPDVQVTNFDDDAPRVLVSPGSVETSENGTTATFDVALNAAPTSVVTIALQSSDASEWTVTPTSLQFDASDWQSTKTVSVSGLDDPAIDGTQIGAIVLAAAQSTDPRFNAIDPPDVIARNYDNDGAAIVVEPTQLVTTERGAEAAFTVRLNALPAAPVVVPIGPIDASEWRVADLEVRLDASNWQSGRSVVVAPVDDAVVDGEQSGVLVLGSAVSTDPDFHGLDPADVQLRNRDDDGPQVLVAPLTGHVVSESGTTASFSVSLTEPPSAAVSIAVSSSDATEFAVSPAEVVFAAGATGPVVVTVTGVDDSDVDGNIVGLAVLAPVISADAGYHGIDPPDVGATNIDDEFPQVLVTPAGSIETSEDGSSAQIEVRVSAAPQADLVIALTNPDASEWAFDRNELRITAANWTQPQVLTITGVNDFDIDGDALGVVGLGSIVSVDARFNGLNPPDVPAVNRDNDRVAAIAVAPDRTLETTEAGGSATFEVRLSTEPTAEVRIALVNPDASEFALDRSEIVFAAASWSTPQVVRVTGVDDSLLDGDISASIGLAPAVSTDARFLGIDPRDVPVVNRNDDFVEPASLVVADIDLSVSEAGDRGRIDIALNRAPAASSRVRLLVTSADTGEVIATPQLLFDAGNATVPQSVILDGVDEFVDDGDQTVTLTIAVSVDSDPDFAALQPITRTVINVDNDVAGLTLALTGPARILESESTSLALGLTSEPTAPVTANLEAVLRAPGQAGDLLYTLVPTTLSIAPADWQSPAPLRLNTLDNRLANGNQVVDIRILSVTSADPNYQGLGAAPVAVEVVDRGAYGLQEIPVDRWLAWLAMLMLLSGGWMMVHRERGGR